MNVPRKTIAWTAAPGGGASGRAEVQEQVIQLLRGVARSLRRQQVRLASGQGFPFPCYGPCLVLLQEISEHPGITINELAR